MYWRESRDNITIECYEDWIEISYNDSFDPDNEKDLKILQENWKEFKEEIKSKKYMITSDFTIVRLSDDEKEFLEEVIEKHDKKMMTVENI